MTSREAGRQGSVVRVLYVTPSLPKSRAKIDKLGRRQADKQAVIFNPLSTMTRFYVHSAHYSVILDSFRNLRGGLK
ncbi:hypothetical protein E2C01_060731 [Portunus trituberculatus]|uniref:Uncharacterized protein n=1 Tax=Portunus trituberculatus TaxID=210409 RepID=A0A5B7H6B5_PORTR|nr:hypothetical protein [Portunus trituberculatus]